MILTTHSIVGSALAKVATANPVLAFAIGMSSHYILDSLPHWEYHLGSATHDPNNRLNDDMVIGKNFVFDLIKIGFDFSLGLALSLLFFYDSNQPSSLFIVLAGVAGGVMPDFLQFVYMKIRREPLVSLQKFHDFFHTALKLKDHHYLNILIQVSLIVGAILVGNIF